MSGPSKPRMGFFPLMGRDFDTFLRRYLIVRVRFWHASRTFASSKRAQAVKSNNAEIVERLFSILVMPCWLVR